MQDIRTKKRELRALQADEFDYKWEMLSSGKKIVLVGAFSLLLLSPFISIAL